LIDLCANNSHHKQDNFLLWQVYTKKHSITRDSISDKISVIICSILGLTTELHTAITMYPQYKYYVFADGKYSNPH